MFCVAKHILVMNPPPLPLSRSTADVHLVCTSKVLHLFKTTPTSSSPPHRLCQTTQCPHYCPWCPF